MMTENPNPDLALARLRISLNALSRAPDADHSLLEEPEWQRVNLFLQKVILKRSAGNVLDRIKAIEALERQIL
jgi:hypothetical protein